MSIWDDVSINSWRNIKLIAETNAAYEYVNRLVEMQDGVHERQCGRLVDIIAEVPNAPKPIMNRLPGWIIRMGDRYNFRYDLIPCHTKTINRIYDLRISGIPTREIGIYLNKHLDEYPVFGWYSKIWTATRVGYLLADQHVRGYVNPLICDGDKRVRTPIKGLLYPAAIDDTKWFAVRRLMLASGAHLRGPRGKKVANLFTGKVFCATCPGSLRVLTAARINRSGTRRSDLICSGNTENGSCKDSTRYDLTHYDPAILHELLGLSSLVPHASTATADVAEQLASIRSQITTKNAMSAALEAQQSDATESAARIIRLDGEVITLRREAEMLELKASASIPFRITGHSGLGGLMLTLAGQDRHIEPGDPRVPLPTRRAVASPAAKLRSKRAYLGGAVRAVAIRLPKPLGNYEPAISTPRDVDGRTYFYKGQGWWGPVDPKIEAAAVAADRPRRSAE